MSLLLGFLFTTPARQQDAPLTVFPDDCEVATPDARSSESTASPQRSEIIERLGAQSWLARGWRGQGLKVAVLDSGFRGYRTHLGKALPRDITVHSFRFDGNLEAKNSQHGILCAEVIHALAPDAQLLLVNWEPEHPDQFLAAVRWARQQGARFISCSVIMPTWSDCEGHGRIHDELARLLGSGDRIGDALFFASAGNTAQRHWSGAFQDGGDGYHGWERSGGMAHRDNAIKPWGDERVSVELCCPVKAGYEVIVSDADNRRVVGRARSSDVGGAGSAVVAFAPESGHDYSVRVRQLRGATGGFHLVVLGGTLHHATSRGSIPFPGDGAEVVAVGAVDSVGRRLSYSSCGPKRNGTKPDLVAPVPFPSAWRSRPFAGTSAAAPQAAALAALLSSRYPDWTARRVRDGLNRAARPCSPVSPAWETGHGLIHLPQKES